MDAIDEKKTEDVAAPKPGIDESSMPKASAKVTVKLPPPLTTPAAFRLPLRPRALAARHAAEFKPDGNPKAELVALAKELIQKMIDSHTEEFDGMEVICEIGGGSAHQINVIVIPHKW